MCNCLLNSLLKNYSLKVHKNSMLTFAEKVLKVVAGISVGQVMTYKEVARRAGSPNASRAVGSIMARNSDVKIPCHRVVRSDGSIGPYNGLRGKSKKELLEDEGVPIVGNKVSI